MKKLKETMIETIAIRHETYRICHTTKTITTSLELIYQGKQIKAFLDP